MKSRYFEVRWESKQELISHLRSLGYKGVLSAYDPMGWLIRLAEALESKIPEDEAAKSVKRIVQ